MPEITTVSCLRPVLVALSEVPQLHITDVTSRVAEIRGLTPAERELRVPGGSATVIRHRCGWARTYLSKAGLIAQVSRGIWRITDDGLAALRRFPSEIRDAELRQHYPSFRSWIDDVKSRARAKRSTESADHDEDSADGEAGAISIEAIPETMVDLEFQMRRLVEADLRERLRGMSPSRFEELVEQLVVKLNYGASDAEVRQALARGSGDGGVDGVIKEDKLGLGQIYLQAKRWAQDSTVGRPFIQAFVGAMHGRAQKGVFITTGAFSRDAREYAESLHGLRLRLIDGAELASLMVDCGLGVSEERVYRTYRIDGDFFDEAD